MKKKLFFLLSLFLDLFQSCLGQKNIDCNNEQHSCSITIGVNHKTTINYYVNNDLSDISFSLGVEKWGPDVIRRYANLNDTLTLAWYYGSGEFNNTIAKKVIDNMAKADSIHLCEQSYVSQKFQEIEGLLLRATCTQYTNFIYYGVNKTSNKIIVAEYNTKIDGNNAQNNFFCILNSMLFKQE